MLKKNVDWSGNMFAWYMTTIKWAIRNNNNTSVAQLLAMAGECKDITSSQYEILCREVFNEHC